MASGRSAAEWEASALEWQQQLTKRNHLCDDLEQKLRKSEDDRRHLSEQLANLELSHASSAAKRAASMTDEVDQNKLHSP